MRYWAWHVAREVGPPAHIQLFVLYNDPKLHPRVPHSLGLQKGLLGVVHVFASKRDAGGNNVVIAHELLHTLGATDKYDPVTDQPVYPEGYAEPGRMPLYPQYLAEVMGGRIPLSATHSEIPGSLKRAVIGRATAVEINWLERR